MRQAAEGHLTTEALMWNQNNDTTISGMTAEDFRKRLNKQLKDEGYDIDNNRYPEGYQEAPLAYDAVWSVALGEFLELLANPPDRNNRFIVFSPFFSSVSTVSI